MENKKKRQRYKDGAIVKINLSGDRLAFGRLMAERVAVYDCISSTAAPMPPIEIIVAKPILFYVSVYTDVITKGEFEIIGHKALTQDDIEKNPPSFWQDLMDINDCIISYAEDRIPQHKATPQECIGLERVAVWDDYGVIERIEDYYAGRKNAHVELQKPILSTDDIRYLPPPLALRWDAASEKYQRHDEEAAIERERHYELFLKEQKEKALLKQKRKNTDKKKLPKGFVFLTEMYQDDYFPNYLVDKVKDAIKELVEFIESGSHSVNEIQQELDRIVVKINNLQEVFEESGSEIETAARDSIGTTIKNILDHFEVNIDIEEAIRERDW